MLPRVFFFSENGFKQDKIRSDENKDCEKKLRRGKKI